MLQSGTIVELDVEKPAAGGRMLARHEGLVVLVSAAIPGERVRALVERTGKGVAYAVAIDVLDASPDRRPAAPDWACGGNVYAHVAYPRQLALKADVVRDALGRIGHIPFDQPIPVSPSPERGYRMRARLHARAGRLGFFREGTHHLCDPATTGQLLPETDRLVGEIADLVRAGRLPGATSVELAENVPATERALHLELDRPLAPTGLEELARLPSVVGAGASFTGRTAPGAGRKGTPREWRRTITAGGAPCVLDELSLPDAAPFRLQHNANAFFQGNRYLLATLAARVRSLVPHGPVIDLYAGVGLFAVSFAASGWDQVVAVESDRAAAADLRANAAPFGASLQPVEGVVEAYLAAHPSAGEAIVIDPPRTGMSREASAALAAWGAPVIVYVSCDVATFARDARRLLDAGYVLGHLEAFDLFPNTAHVEVVALFSRA